MNERDFLDRTKKYGLRAVRAFRALPKGDEVASILGRQMLRSATSVGANYRSACRARSRPDMIATSKVAEEEADESIFWMEMLTESGSMPRRKLCDLMSEGNEITGMLVASIKTLRQMRLNRQS